MSIYVWISLGKSVCRGNAGVNTPWLEIIFMFKTTENYIYNEWTFDVNRTTRAMWITLPLYYQYYILKGQPGLLLHK